MKVIYNFLELNSQEKLSIIKALILQWLIRIMLWLIPFSIIQNLIKRITSFKGHYKNPDISVEKLIWAVNVTSRYTARSNCLTKALTAQILLSRYHYSSIVKIGVGKDEGEFEAHAWLVYNNKIILGESKKDYVPLMDIGDN